MDSHLGRNVYGLLLRDLCGGLSEELDDEVLVECLDEVWDALSNKLELGDDAGLRSGLRDALLGENSEDELPGNSDEL